MKEQALSVLLALAVAGEARAQCIPVETGFLTPSGGLSSSTVLTAGGDLAALSAPTLNNTEGLVYLFERDQGGPGNWGQTLVLTASDAAPDTYFGASVSISGDLMAVGAPEDDVLSHDSGSVYILQRTGPGQWVEIAKLVAQPPFFFINDGDRFGQEVALDGDRILVGAPEEPTNATCCVNDGAAYIFERDLGGPNNWGLVKKFSAVGEDNGEYLTLDGVTATNEGWVYGKNAGGLNNWGLVSTKPGRGEIWLAGDLIVRGHSLSQLVGQNAGAAFLHERNFGGTENWGLSATLTASDTQWGDQFGSAVVGVGDVVYVGCHQDGMQMQGSVYVYGRHFGGQDSWGEVGRFTNATNSPNDFFGSEMALGGSTLFVRSGEGTHIFEGVYPISTASYCTAGTTASGCSATISASGTPSASQGSGFDVLVSGSEGQKDGVIYFGTNGAQANPWGNGTSFQCVVPPVVRTQVQSGVGTLGACDGSFQLDFNAWMGANPARAPAVGAEVRMQAWFRDPLSSSNQSTSLSDGLLFAVCP